MDQTDQLQRLDIAGIQMAECQGASEVSVTPEYSNAFGIGLARGRWFTAADGDRAPLVALVNEALARTCFGGAADLLGRTVQLGGRKERMTIIGVVRDARHENLRHPAPPTIYTPLAQQFDGRKYPPRRVTAALRTDGNVKPMLAAAPGIVLAVHHGAVVTYVRTLKGQIDATLKRERLLATLSSGFGILALVLATVGVLGVMSYRVAQRAQETGIRIALGATRAAVLRRALREAAVLSATGVAIGLFVTLLGSRILSTFLFGLSPNDPSTLLGVAGLLIATTLLAGLIPARRAAGTDPMRVLRAT